MKIEMTKKWGGRNGSKVWIPWEFVEQKSSSTCLSNIEQLAASPQLPTTSLAPGSGLNV
jgi:hypothetical protein